jgi:hypothetical protein
MLLFSYKLERYIKKKILPRILLSNNYFLKGSFSRRALYVTDIDVVNKVYPEINPSNIYDKLCDLIRKVQGYNDILLIRITFGYDTRFEPISNTDELNKLNGILKQNEIDIINSIKKKYQSDTKSMLFFLNDYLRGFYKIRWTADEVLNNKKILRGDTEVQFTDFIDKSESITIKYYAMIGSYPLGIDAVINYAPLNLKKVYKESGMRTRDRSGYRHEYYYMLFPLRAYFRKNKQIYNEINDVIEVKYGLYKQLMVRIENYHLLYLTGFLKPDLASKIVYSIVKDVGTLENFDSNTIKYINNVKTGDMMKEWDLLLEVLWNEINDKVNELAKNDFTKYIAMVPDKDRESCCREI